MKNFKGTLVFFLVVLAVGGFALYEYKKQESEQKEELTEKHIFKALTANQASFLEIRGPKSSLKVDSVEGVLRLVSPIEDDLDPESLEDYLEDLFSQDVEVAASGDSGAEGSLDWGKYGLESPAHVIKFRLNDGKDYKVELGSIRTYDDGYYIRKNGESDLLVGGTAWSNLLEKSPADFRSRALRLPTEAYERLRFRNRTKGNVFTYTLRQKDEIWSNPAFPGVKLDITRLETFFNRLGSLTGTKVAAPDKSSKNLKEKKLLSPEFHLDIWTYKKGDSGPTIRETLKISEEVNGEYFAVSDKAPAIYTLAKRDVLDIKKTFRQLRDRKYPFIFDHNRTKILSLRLPNKILDFVNADASWKLDPANPPSQSEPVSGRPLYKHNKIEFDKLLSSKGKIQKQNKV